MRISDVLCAGAENALTGEFLSGLFDCGLREVSQRIERERRDGAPICASCDSARPGYFLASDPEELALYLASLDRRLQNIAVTRRHLQDTLDRMCGQVSVDWGDQDE